MNAKLYRAACDLFHKACALPPEQRDGFIERHSGDDRALRALVHELLANDPERSQQATTSPGSPPAGDDT
ncbi:MAG: hypothetical protein OEY32_16020, partial [Candidatus Krumholzibacteria bacterium]|nr:hypothetical protein [Candidatus Krumholzibacteria bacterium]